MSDFWTGSLALTGTIFVYGLAKKLNQRYPSPFTLPILTSTIFFVLFLLVFDISYQTYLTGGRWIDYLLEPAVVALAYPLYKQWQALKANLAPLLIGVTIGSMVGVSSGLLFAKWFGFEEMVIYSLVPKSITTPVAMEVADSLSGSPALAAVFVMVAGIGGAVIGPALLDWTGVYLPVSRGIGMGNASHAIGTAKIMETSQEAGAASTVAMILSAIIVSIISPLFVTWLV